MRFARAVRRAVDDDARAGSDAKALEEGRAVRVGRGLDVAIIRALHAAHLRLEVADRRELFVSDPKAARQRCALHRCAAAPAA